MLKVWGILTGAVAAYLAGMGWTVYQSYLSMLKLNATASAIQVSQIANQCLVELAVLGVALLALLVLVQVGTLIWNTSKA